MYDRSKSNSTDTINDKTDYKKQNNNKNSFIHTESITIEDECKYFI